VARCMHMRVEGILLMLYILQLELHSNGDYKDVRVVIVLSLENGFKRVEHNQ